MQKTEREKLEALTRELVQAYFVQRDYGKLLGYISPQISWFGTGEKEVCRSLMDATRYLGQEQELYQGCFTVAREWYHVKMLTAEFACVMARMDVAADPASGYYLNLPVRFSIVYQRKGGKWRVCHVHNSVPYHGQGDASFFDRDVAEKNYARMNEIALSVAEGYVKDEPGEDDPANRRIKSTMELRLQSVLHDPQTMRQVLVILDDYAREKKEIRRARQIAGIEAAKRRNVRLGRPPMPLPEGFEAVYQELMEGRLNKSSAARKLNISANAMARLCKRYEDLHSDGKAAPDEG